MSGRQWFAVAAIGRDRPGIVADLSEYVFACGCNLEDASMTMLGNEFATLMLVSGVGENLAATLSDAARKLEWERRLTVFIRPIQDAPAPSTTPDHSSWFLTARGIDKAGLVARVARCLAERNVLITDLRGKITPMAESGTPLYTLSLRMRMPVQADIAELRRTLEKVSEQLGVEIELRHEDEFS